MHKIYIEEFWAIKQAELEIDKILVLIGAQASGKSTVSKLVFFFKSLRQDLLTLVYKHITSAELPNVDTEEMRKSFWYEVRMKFVKYFGSTKHLPDFTIKYAYSIDKYITLSLHPDRNLRIDFSPTLFEEIFRGDFPTLIQRSIKQRFSQDNIYEQINFSASIKAIEQAVNQIFEDSHLPHFIPANRNLTVAFSDQLKLLFFGSLSSDISALEKDLVDISTNGRSVVPASASVDLYLMSEFMRYTEKIKERFKNQDFVELVTDVIALDQEQERLLLDVVLEKIALILRAEYRQDRYGEKLYYSEQGYVDLNDASSGQQESIRILQDLFLVVLDRTSAFRVIEEPEAHLYPMAQKHLIELMAMMLNQTDSQLVITTHSPYTLSVFNNLLYATHVVTADPAAASAIAETIPALCWLNPQTFNAYMLKDGYCQSIVNKDLGLIGQNFLDEISEELGDEFDKLYGLHAKVYA